MSFVTNQKTLDDKGCFLLIFYGDEVLVRNAPKDEVGARACGRERLFPSPAEIKESIIQPEIYYIGSWREMSFYAAEPVDKFGDRNFTLKKVRSLYGEIEDGIFNIVLRGLQAINWIITTKFCGCCGAGMRPDPQEFAMRCADCGHIVFPRISPAVIVAVIKDDKILLAHATRFKSSLYSVIAGFVEIGETLEECVRRELKEEVGIEVTDINYFKSQPWPFPDSLMIAFTARYLSGEISIDHEEIDDAGWYTPEILPELPSKLSVARSLIDWFLES